MAVKAEDIVFGGKRAGDMTADERLAAIGGIDANFAAVVVAFNRAIDFAIDHAEVEAPGSGVLFLDAWRIGDTSEWPEFKP